MTIKERKIQAIKNAYGEYYDICKPDENGWVSVNHLLSIKLPIMKHIDCDVDDFGDIGFYRPKSLQGIETNNGWISVNDRLPNKEGMYFVYTDKDESYVEYCCKKSDQRNHKMFYSMVFMEFMTNDKVTHWQPINKPPKPIY